MGVPYLWWRDYLIDKINYRAPSKNNSQLQMSKFYYFLFMNKVFIPQDLFLK